MAELYVTAKLTASLETISTANTAARSPDSFTFAFASEKRIENQIIGIAANGSSTITIANEGMSTTSLLKLEVVTVNKGVNLKFNGDLTGVDILPTSSTDKALFIATADFDSVVITNLDASNPINVAISIYEKKA